MNTKPILIAIMSEQSRMSIFAHFPKRTWTCCGFLQLGEGPQGVCELLQAHLVPGRSSPLDNTIIYDRHSAPLAQEVGKLFAAPEAAEVRYLGVERATHGGSPRLATACGLIAVSPYSGKGER